MLPLDKELPRAKGFQSYLADVSRRVNADDKRIINAKTDVSYAAISSNFTIRPIISQLRRRRSRPGRAAPAGEHGAPHNGWIG